MSNGLVALIVLLLVAAFVRQVPAHEGHGDSPPCNTEGTPSTIHAPYVPGTITIDGNKSDWDSVDAELFKLVQAIGPPDPYPQGTGELLVKAAHDGQNIYILLVAPGDFVWSGETPHLGPAVSIMFGIGDDATFDKMGGCPAPPGQCSEEACRGHEVDLLHFQLHTAVPGRLYGGSPADTLKASGRDSFGHLSDMWGWSPFCKEFDGPPASSGLNASSPLWAASGAQNDWHGAWSHSTITAQQGLLMSDAPFGKTGQPGYFVFEFSRPLRTLDRYQQDVQLSIGGSHPFGVGLWYPMENGPWDDSQHYVTSCDWVALHLQNAPRPAAGWAQQTAAQGLSNSAAAAIAAMALLLSMAAVFVAMVAGWWVRTNARQFTPMDGL